MDLYTLFGIIFGTYIVVYIILFVFPTIIHPKRNFPISNRILSFKQMAGFAHRGGQKENFENSLSAFKHSLELKYFGLELDVHKTKDNKFVIFHDRNLKRGTGQDILISDIDFKDILPYKKTIYDEWNEENDTFENKPTEKAPLLEDLLKLVRRENVGMSIDLKSNCPDDFKELIHLIIENGVEDKVIIGGFDSKKCHEKMKEMKINLPMFFDVKDCVWFFFSVLFGFLPFISFRNDWLMVPHGFHGFKNSHLYRTYKLAKLAYFIFWIESFYFVLVSWHMNRRGIPVIFWVLNTEVDWELGAKMGANALMTDYPSRMKDYFENQNNFAKW